MNTELLHPGNILIIALITVLFMAATRWLATQAGYNLPDL